MTKMLLTLHYQDRSRVWAELINTAGDRVFVQTDELHPIGATVSILVEAPELPAPLGISGVVQGLRSASGALSAGLFVHLDPSSVERCRIAIGATNTDAPRASTRREPRVDCKLPARVLAPRVIDNCFAKSLSMSGFTLLGSGIALSDEQLNVAITLPGGATVEVGAKVVWVRTELALAGFRITTLTPRVSDQVASAIEKLSGTTQSAKDTGGTIVVADDDPSILDFTFRTISGLGHRVLRADRGDTALALIREVRPRLILLDVLMPGLDGLEVCKAVRADETLARVPIVLLSAMGEARLAEAVKTSGANDYLVKPMRIDALRAVVSRHLR